MKIKMILFISNHLRGLGGAAGIRSWQQARVLSGKYKLKVLIPRYDPVTEERVSEKTYSGLDLDKVDVSPVFTLPLNRKSKINRTIFYLISSFGQLIKGVMSKRCTCVLTMSLPVTSLCAATLISIIKRIPLVVDVRDMPFETAIEMNYLKESYLTKIAMAIESVCLKQAKSVITNSPYYKTILISKGVEKEKITVAPIGYDGFPPPAPAMVAKKREEICHRFHGKEISTLIVYCGTFGYFVEVDRILEVAESLKMRSDIGFVFVGSGQRIDEYKKKVEEKSINAVFLGRVPKESIQPICRASDVCIYASKDGHMSSALLGNKIFDYLGACRPIVYSGPMPSAVSDVLLELGAGLTSESQDVDQLHKDIIELADDPEMRKQLGDAASKYHEHGYTSEASAQKLSDIIDRLHQ